MANTTPDIVELLNEDHQEAKQLLEEITQADAESASGAVLEAGSGTGAARSR